MQRVELLVWRDFVNTLRKSPKMTIPTLMLKHGLTQQQAIEWRQLYNKTIQSPNNAQS
jgi:hypothetical protein